MFSDVWSENAALFERLVEIHSNPPMQLYGFNRALEPDRIRDFGLRARDVRARI